MKNTRLELLLGSDPDLSALYFSAAEELGDLHLLPVVLEAAQRWRSMDNEGEELNVYVKGAVETLQCDAGEAGTGPGGSTGR